MPKPFSTPILFIIFNRPDTTARVFAEIKKLKPTRLYIAADGPRKDRPDDTRKCEAARAVVAEIDWPCEVRRRYLSGNVGCGRGVSSAISWFFEHEEAGIILEDDCVPHETFFPFCRDLLEYYRQDENIMHISGDNFVWPHEKKYSYYFSRYPHCWGWATWRRAWKHFAFDMETYNVTVGNQVLSTIFKKKEMREYWHAVFSNANAREDTWDYQWTFAVWNANGLCVIPAVNLVTNIGFRTDATHTKKESEGISNLVAQNTTFPLRHPPSQEINQAADTLIFTRNFKPRSLLFHRILQRVERWGRRIARYTH